MRGMVLTSFDPAVLHIARGYLETHDIVARVVGESRLAALGSLPADQWPELWVPAQQLDRARSLLETAESVDLEADGDGEEVVLPCAGCGARLSPGRLVCPACSPPLPDAGVPDRVREELRQARRALVMGCALLPLVFLLFAALLARDLERDHATILVANPPFARAVRRTRRLALTLLVLAATLFLLQALTIAQPSISSLL